MHKEQGMATPRSHRFFGRSVKHAASTLLAASLIAGCATSTVPDYRPRTPSGTVGYRDLQLSPNRYRVSFSGSTASTRDDVERYLLRRAAEITLASGYTHFVLSGRDTERDTFYGNNYLYGPYPYYYPYRSWYWDYPYGSGGWQTVTYSAYGDIMMLTPEEARRFPEAIEALGLLQRLQPPAPVAWATP
jgi:hypothetical protein